MKILVKYYNIDNGASIFAVPQFTHSEVVEVDGLNDPKLIEYITNKKDFHGCNFKKKDKPFMGFDYVSNQGGVKVSLYKEPNIIKL